MGGVPIGGEEAFCTWYGYIVEERANPPKRRTFFQEGFKVKATLEWGSEGGVGVCPEE